MRFKNEFSADNCHNILLDKKPIYRYKKGNDFVKFKIKLRKAFLEVLGDMPKKVDLQIKIEKEIDKGDYLERYYSFLCEKDTRMPCCLLIPKTSDNKKIPVVISLQGHSMGMHISLGEVKYDCDKKMIDEEELNYGERAVKFGYAVLCIEQRAFGERLSQKMLNYGVRCDYLSAMAIILGRTLVGERVWDISRAIDTLQNFKELDLDRIMCIGHSGGGTAAYYAACYDERIKMVLASCSVCSYKKSIAKAMHCQCNYLPSCAKYFDMGDLSALIYPRNIILVAGDIDKMFAIEGVIDTFKTIKDIYSDNGEADRCSMLIGEGGHRFYSDISFKEFNKNFDKYIK